ncbi:hypothetical protein GCM10023108_45820 [Saccharopolyspora hordei]
MPEPSRAVGCPFAGGTGTVVRGYRGGMASYGELLPGRKLKHEGDQGGISEQHDPGGPLDLERGVVYLAPPAKPARDEPEDDDPGERG